MKNFWIIDGSSLVHREYFSSIPLEMKYARTPEEKQAEEWRLLQINGTYINAINGFFTQLKAIMTFQKPDYLAVCFDKSRLTTFRRELYPEYKAQRNPTPYPLKQQMEKTRRLCKEMGIPTFYSDEYEADDYAGSLAKKYASPDVKVHLLTTDRDYLQLIDDNTICHMMITNKEKYDQLVHNYGQRKGPLGTYEYDANICYSELKLLPNQITDWKGLSGDVSDNIPGVKGVSDRSVIPLLREYQSIDGIYSYLDSHSDDDAKESWKGLGISRSPVAALRKGEKDAFFFKDLATIKTDIPIEMNLREFSNLPGNEEFSNLANEYGLMALDDLLSRINDYENRRSFKLDKMDRVQHFNFDNESVIKEDSISDHVNDEQTKLSIESTYTEDLDEPDDEYGEDFDMWA